MPTPASSDPTPSNPGKIPQDESVMDFLRRKAREWRAIQLQANLNNDSISSANPIDPTEDEPPEQTDSLAGDATDADTDRLDREAP